MATKQASNAPESPKAEARKAEDGFIKIFEPIHQTVFGPATFFMPYLPEVDMNGDKVERDSYPEIGFPMLGMVLDLRVNDNWILWEIINHPKNKAIKAIFTPNSPSQRYKIVDAEKDASEYIQSFENKVRMQSEVIKLKDRGDDADIRRVGRSFGITGSVNVILANLLEMPNTAAGLAKMSKYFMSPDKDLIDLIYTSLSTGNANDEQGLYLSTNGIYKYNELVIGTSFDDVTAFLKKAENKEIYAVLKKAVFDEGDKQ